VCVCGGHGGARTEERGAREEKARERGARAESEERASGEREWERGAAWLR